MSEFSFLENKCDVNEEKPDVVKQMNYLIEHKCDNPHTEKSSESSECNEQSFEIDIIKQKQYLIDNGIPNPNTSKKYKKVCDELTCNSSDIQRTDCRNKTFKHKDKKSKDCVFDRTSEVCDFPTESEIFKCNSSEKDHKYKHTSKHTSKHKHKCSPSISPSCEEDNSDREIECFDKKRSFDKEIECFDKKRSFDKEILNKKLLHDDDFLEDDKNCARVPSPTDSLMCDSGVDFLKADVYDKISDKYKHYIPHTKKILKNLHNMLMSKKINCDAKKDMFNTVMKIKNNKKMYHIFKVVSEQSDYDFDEIVKAVCKMSLSS